MGKYMNKAVSLRPIIEKAAQNGLEDTDALNAIDLFPLFDPNGHEYKLGDRFRFNGVLYKTNQDHTSQTNWDPSNAPSLYSQVLVDPSGKPQVWVRPDSTNPYMRDDRVLYPDENGDIYRSLIDNNTWSPDEYPYGWEKEV